MSTMARDFENVRGNNRSSHLFLGQDWRYALGKDGNCRTHMLSKNQVNK